MIHKIRGLMARGKSAEAKRLVPKQRPYDVPEHICAHLAMDADKSHGSR